MQYQEYSNKLDRYELAQGYYLQRADNEEFTKWWAAYRNINEDFAQSYSETQKELEGVNFCFWIVMNGKRVGGCVMLPNGIGDFFLIPPENDAEKILSIVIPLLENWSDNSKAIGAQAIPSRYLDIFQSNGFTLQESRSWMIRPTARMKEKLPSDWLIKRVQPIQAQEIAALFKQAFERGVGQYAQRSFDAHLASVDSFFKGYDENSLCGRASAIARENHARQPAGVCLVDIHKNLPAIRFIVVAPSYRRRGLATLLLNRAISILEPGYNWVKLAVTTTNPAVDVYRNLGFISGDELHQLSKPASQSVAAPEVLKR